MFEKTVLAIAAISMIASFALSWAASDPGRALAWSNALIWFSLYVYERFESR